MLELKGSKNKAKVFTDVVDSETIGQIIELCNQESLKDSKIRVMPDCHKGRGSTIGTTMTVGSSVIPNLVGTDIGCGVTALNLGKCNIDFDLLHSIIESSIPSGLKLQSSEKERGLDRVLKDVFDVDLSNIHCISNVNRGRVLLSVGTLGRGNHFIELGKDSKDNIYLVVHAGSRKLGEDIANHYQELAINHCNKKYNDLGINKPFNDLCYLEGDLKANYLDDMLIAKKYAFANRVIILSRIVYNYKNLEVPFNEYCKEVATKVIDCVHNYVDLEDNVLRKGAVSSKEGEDVLIPINMLDGMLIGKGKGSEEWNYSAPHGAGRLYSRSCAKDVLTLEDFEKDMEGIYSKCIDMSRLSESPRAYKSLESILNNIEDTIDVVDVIKPLYNFKG